MRHVTLLGCPIEAGAGRRGCVMGPAALRTAGLADQLSALGLTVEDRGDLSPMSAPDAALPAPCKQVPEIAGWTRAIRAAGRALPAQTTPIWMGGDHALAFGTLLASAERAAAKGRPLFVLWLDAHSDFHTPASTESGNMHGLPLAFACGLPGFDPILGQANPVPLDPAKICLIGLRSVDEAEGDLVEAAGVEAHDMRAIDELGIKALLEPFLQRVEAAGGDLHVSLDVDFLDPEIAPAVGTTVPGGATFREAHHAMELLFDSELMTALDLVELNPFLDERGRTAKLMTDLAASAFGRRVLDRRTRSY